MLVPPVSVTVKLAEEPSATVEAPANAAVRSSSSSIVPVAVAVPRLTPDGKVVPVIATVSVSSPSASASSAVATDSVAEESPAVMVNVPELTAV